MNRSIIEDRDIEVDKMLHNALLSRKGMPSNVLIGGRIDEGEECIKDILSERFLNWNSIDATGIENSFFLKEALSRLERIPPLTSSYPIETHRKSLLGKGIVWFKRMILKLMMRFDTSLKYQNQVNLAMTEVIHRLVQGIESMEDRIREQQGIIDKIKERL